MSDSTRPTVPRFNVGDIITVAMSYDWHAPHTHKPSSYASAANLLRASASAVRRLLITVLYSDRRLWLRRRTLHELHVRPWLLG